VSEGVYVGVASALDALRGAFGEDLQILESDDLGKVELPTAVIVEGDKADAGRLGGAPEGVPEPSSLVYVTKLPSDELTWAVSVYPDSGEAVIMARAMYPADKEPCAACELGNECEKHRKAEPNEEESRRCAAARALVALRRYCTANHCERLVTLTYAEAEHDPRQVAIHMSRFVQRLRNELGLRGGEVFAYAWVRELHPGGHGWHVHMAVSRYINQRLLDRTWGKGRVDIRALGARNSRDGARRAAVYLAKYVGKSFGGGALPKGMHRYEVGQGCQPRREVGVLVSYQQALGYTASFFGGELPSVTFSSDDYGDAWSGPPLRVLFWSEAARGLP
jgi:hypothetical protein